ncbi:MAG: hypothetical protein KDD92_15510 [Caldilineaceae bacterium]|nr:hypothetical protein [Caldilineaceae bacterium]
MYALDRDRGGAAFDDIPCFLGSQLYGCTMDQSNIAYAYPFPSSTITIGIDDISGSDNAYYAYPYLWDLVTTELGVYLKGGSSLPDNGNVPLAAIEAQAIASRTFTYHRDEYVGVIDNSTRYHAYIPFSYEVLLDESQKEDVRNGTLRRFYLTESNTSYPIDAQYGADSPDPTVEGLPTLVSDINYLQSVADPISAAEGILSGNGQGLSSRGSRRWSYGYQSWVPTEADDFWSVRWDDAFQSLTHYYTGIHIRDANSGNAILTPTRRWVPLRIAQLNTPTDTIRLCDNGPTTLIATVQNTGVYNWGPEAFDLSYQPTWSTETLPRELPDNINYVPATDAGDSATTAVTIMVPDNAEKGSAIIRLDMRAYNADGSDYEWFSEGGWPGYAINAEVVECGNNIELGVFLPIVTLGGPVVQ